MSTIRANQIQSLTGTAKSVDNLALLSDLEQSKVFGEAGPRVPVMVNIPMGDQNDAPNDYGVYNGESVHPSVIRIEEGFGTQGFQYWMAITPYIEQDDQTENPNVFASHNGVDWQIPEGGSNPITPTPAATTSHLSDPCILKVGSQLYLYYRETDTTTNTSTLKLKTSPDGVTWGAETTLTGAFGEALSPTVRYQTDGSFFMWVVTTWGSVVRLTSTNGVDFINSTPVVLSGLPAGQSAWHLDVIQSDDQVEMILNTSSAAGGGPPNTIDYLVSTDASGLAFNHVNVVLSPADDFESLYLYKACFLPTKDDRYYDLWWTGAATIGGGVGRWRTAYTIATLDADGNLIPMNSSGDRQVTFDTIVAPSALISNLTVGRLFNEQPRVLLGISADTSYPSGNNYLTFDRSFFDNYGIWQNASSNTIVVPEGFFQCEIKYQVNWQTGQNEVGSRFTIAQINESNDSHPGLPSVWSPMNTTPINTNASSARLHVVPGDTIKLLVNHTSATNQIIQDSTWMEVTFF